MIHLSKSDLENSLNYDVLIPRIHEAFTKNYKIPQRHHHQYPNPKEGTASTLLLMPAWDDGENLGVKIVNVSPNNGKYDLPTIQGHYMLFDLPTGTPKAMMDAKLLTAKRTAATSAMASKMLSIKEASTLLVIGTGTLCKELVSAHCAVRPIEKVMIWGRNFKKAKAIADDLDFWRPTFAVEHLDSAIKEADIISCATMSPTPLIFGKNIRPGQHFDMIGAYKPDMREADDSFISAVDIFVDSYEGASKETGDLAIPLANGTIKMTDLKASLFELCKNEKPGRQSKEQITCFKSVGHALEDLAAASLAFEHTKIIQQEHFHLK
jgi:ornithine cyclodeaminase/alanine dehydrogenase-like protein (mu-crystallin family)